jgi:septum formation inhibitor-activating ATPase MinD
MKIISLVNQKGGVAKTTSVVNIACALVELGKKVLDKIKNKDQKNINTYYI